VAQYHLTIGSQGYLIDLASYRKTAGDQFAGKQAVSTRLYADLRDVEVWAQQDWSGGRGALRWTAETAHHFSGGTGLNTLTASQLTSGYAATEIANWAHGTSYMNGLVGYKSALYGAVVAGGNLFFQRMETEGAVAGFGSIAGPTIAGALAAYKDAVWVGSGSDGKLGKYDPGAATFTLVTTIAGSPSGINAMAVYVPSGTSRLLYLGVDYSAGAQVYAWDATTATSLITLEQSAISQMFTFDGKLYVCAVDAGGNGLLYSYDGTTWRLLRLIQDNWIQSSAAFGERMYLGSGRDNRIWRFDGRDLVEVFAGRSPNGSRIRALAVLGSVLYAGAAASDSFRTLIATRNGTDWHELRPSGLTAAASNGLGIRSMGVLNGVLYLAEELSSGVAKVFKLDTAAYNSSGTLETVRFDGDLPSVDKAWRRVTVTHTPLASGQSVVVEYRLDGATSWTALVSNSTVSSTTSTATFANGTSGREIELRYTIGSGGTNTLAIKSVLVEYGLVPDTRREWVFDVLLEGEASAPLRLLDGSLSSLTGAQQSAQLWTDRGTKGTVAFVDLDGTSYRAYFADLAETVAKGPHRDGWQTRARVKLVEA
jgi:hypothetical protein